mgnify:FL=1
MKSKPLVIAIFVLTAALLIGFYGTQSNDSENNSTGKTTAQHETARSSTSEARDNRSTYQSEEASNQLLEEEIPEKYAAMFRKYLGDDSISIANASEGLLKIAADPTAPINARQDALEHALNLTNDTDFENINAALSTQENTVPEPLVQTVLDDSYNREHSTQVETAYQIITNKYSEEITEEAIELLEFHTDENHGDDTDAWIQAVERYRLGDRPIAEEFTEKE